MIRTTSCRIHLWRLVLVLVVTGGAMGLSAVCAASPGSSTAEIQRQFERAVSLIEAGQTAAAEQLYRNIVQYDPHDSRAYEALLALASQRPLQNDSLSSLAAQSRLPEHFVVHQSERFVLISDVAESVMNQNARWVERAHAEFNRFARDCGLRPLPLQHKLVCILFDRREDYLTFAQSHDGLNNVNFTGYYSPRNDRVVFSVEPDRALPRRTNAPTRAVAVSGDGKSVLGFDSRGLNGESSPAPHAEGECDHDHELPSDSAAKCVHEVIHQLMFHTRLMSPDVQYPLWICEGLSTAFETDVPNRPFGPDYDYAPRRDAFQALLRNDELIPLRQFVAITQVTSSKPWMASAVYQQSYALVTWLSRERKAQVREYLHIMRSQPAGKMSPGRHLHLFESVFGEVDAVEKDWLAYEQSGARGQ